VTGKPVKEFADCLQTLAYGTRGGSDSTGQLASLGTPLK